MEAQIWSVCFKMLRFLCRAISLLTAWLYRSPNWVTYKYVVYYQFEGDSYKEVEDSQQLVQHAFKCQTSALSKHQRSYFSCLKHAATVQGSLA